MTSNNYADALRRNFDESAWQVVGNNQNVLATTREDDAPMYCVTAIGDVEERAPFAQVARARDAACILSRTLDTRVTVWRANDGEAIASYLRGTPIV